MSLLIIILTHDNNNIYAIDWEYVITIELMLIFLKTEKYIYMLMTERLQKINIVTHIHKTNNLFSTNRRKKF